MLQVCSEKHGNLKAENCKILMFLNGSSRLSRLSLSVDCHNTLLLTIGRLVFGKM